MSLYVGTVFHVYTWGLFCMQPHIFVLAWLSVLFCAEIWIVLRYCIQCYAMLCNVFCLYAGIVFSVRCSIMDASSSNFAAQCCVLPVCSSCIVCCDTQTKQCGGRVSHQLGPKDGQYLPIFATLHHFPSISQTLVHSIQGQTPLTSTSTKCDDTFAQLTCLQGKRLSE